MVSVDYSLAIIIIGAFAIGYMIFALFVEWYF